MKLNKKAIMGVALAAWAYSGAAFSEVKLPGTKLDSMCGDIQMANSVEGEGIRVCTGKIVGSNSEYISLLAYASNIRSRPMYYEVVQTKQLEGAVKNYAITGQDELVIVKLDQDEGSDGYYAGYVKLAGEYYGVDGESVKFSPVFHTQSVIGF